MRTRLFGACLLGAAAAALAAAPASAVHGSGIAEVHLTSPDRASHGAGTALFVIYDRGAPEIDLKTQSLPGDRHPAFFAWLVDERGRVLIGGIFPRTRRHGFSGSLVMAGPAVRARADLRATKHLVITCVPRPRARRIVKDDEPRFRASFPIVGDRILAGRVEPLGGG
jgi:hypothetical protein